MDEVKVSVIVPIYNIELYLPNCIDSLLKQTFKEFELILVNDGSTDNCGRICDEYALMDNRVKVHHKVNGGVADARNLGLKESTGEYILFIDSDDWCEPIMIEYLYKRILLDSSDIAIFGYIIDYTNNNFSVERRLDNNNYYLGNAQIAKAIYELDQRGMFNSTCNKLYKNQIIKNINLYFDIDGMPGEDLLFNSLYFRNLKSISFIDITYYHYMRRDEESMVSRYWPNLYDQIQGFNKARKDLYDFYEMTSSDNNKCYANTFIGYVSSCIPNMFRANCKMSIREKKAFIQEIMGNCEIQKYINISVPKNFYGKLFKFLYKSNTPIVMYILYSLLFKFRYRFDGAYRTFRKKIFFRARKFTS